MHIDTWCSTIGLFEVIVILQTKRYWPVILFNIPNSNGDFLQDTCLKQIGFLGNLYKSKALLLKLCFCFNAFLEDPTHLANTPKELDNDTIRSHWNIVKSKSFSFPSNVDIAYAYHLSKWDITLLLYFWYPRWAYSS